MAHIFISHDLADQEPACQDLTAAGHVLHAESLIEFEASSFSEVPEQTGFFFIANELCTISPGSANCSIFNPLALCSYRSCYCGCHEKRRLRCRFYRRWYSAQHCSGIWSIGERSAGFVSSSFKQSTIHTKIISRPIDRYYTSGV